MELRIAQAQREALDLHVLEESLVVELCRLALAQAHDAVVRRVAEAAEGLIAHEPDVDQLALVNGCCRPLQAQEGDLV